MTVPPPPPVPAAMGPESRQPLSGPPAARDHPLVVTALLALIAVAIAVTWAAHPEGLSMSSDEGWEPVPLATILLPLVLVLAAVALVPPRPETSTVQVHRPRRARAEVLALLILALAFPLLVPLLPLPEDYVLLKAVLFLLAPSLGLWLLARRAGPSVTALRPALRWWLPLVPLLLHAGLIALPPFAAEPPSQWPPRDVVIVAATATAITASFGEELFYRRFLQTRLEGLCGRWSGILLTAVVFAIMHVPSHTSWSVVGVAQVVALQGSFGVMVGWMWSRYRRLWVPVSAHLLTNGLLVLLHLAGVAGY